MTKETKLKCPLCEEYITGIVQQYERLSFDLINLDGTIKTNIKEGIICIFFTPLLK